jgi:hypothetical protein
MKQAPRTLTLISTGIVAACTVGAAPQGPPSVGTEGRLDGVLLPGVELVVKPQSLRSPLSLRIAATYPHGTAGFRYDFIYVGFEPGRHDLTKFLEPKVPGTTVAPLPAVEVEVVPVLPAGPPGLLRQPERDVSPRLGGYRALAWTAGITWVVGLVGLILWRRKEPDPSALATAPPDVATRLRPLLERAVTGDLDPAGKAELERLLVGFWREKLDLGALDIREGLRRLHAHDEAGALLRRVEAWLHRPPGSISNSEITDALRPYLSPAN